MKKDNEQQNIAIAVLKEQMREVKIHVAEILNNHLPHMQKEIDKIKWYIAMGVGIMIAAEVFIKLIH